MDPNARYRPKPSKYALTSIGILLVEALYFIAVLPYSSIPNKPVFWIAFIVWTIPPIAVEWLYVNAPTKPEINAYANMMIGVGILAIALVIASGPISALDPIAMALVPGLLAGGLIGSDSTLVWKLRNW